MNVRELVSAVDKMVMGLGKNIFDKVLIENNVKIELFDESGKLKDCKEIHNTTTTVGKYLIADQLLAAPSYAKPGWMEVGTGVPTATLLGTYIAGSRTALSAKTRTDNVVTMVCTFAAGVGTGAITEAGIFNVVTENTETMLVSATFGVVTKAATDSLTITWTLTIN